MNNIFNSLSVNHGTNMDTITAVLVKVLCTTVASLSLLMPFSTNAATVISEEGDRRSIAITIYNGNIALVKETRKANLSSGIQALEIKGVSAQMMPETVLFSSSAKTQPTILEQNFDYDLLTPGKLLDKYVGKKIRLARTNPATGKETVEEAIVLSNNQGPVIKVGNRIETNPSGRFIFDSIPDNLRDTPTLSVLLDNPSSGRDDISLSYLTNGMDWKADYVASLNAKNDSLNLNGWVTLTNNSGANYQSAKLQLVAGDVNRVPQPRAVRRNKANDMVMMEMSSQGMQQESLFEYHLYSLDRPTTIRNNQKKQVSLLNASDVSVKKNLILEGGSYYYQGRNGGPSGKLKFGVFVEFKNEKNNRLGIPLPKGTVRVYKDDSKGNSQFIGEDTIDHTANKGKIKLKLGESFDVFAERKQTDYEIVEKLLGRNVVQTSHEITITNGKKQAETVIIRESLPGEWRITKESNPSKKLDAHNVEWEIPVAAESEVKLTFTVRTKL